MLNNHNFAPRHVAVPDTAFARAMRHAMIDGNIGASVLSRATGISRVSLYQYIHGERQPKLHDAAAIANALGIAHLPLSQFLLR